MTQLKENGMAKLIDRVGQVFGELEIIEQWRDGCVTLVKARCSCGQWSVMQSRNLVNGNSTRCVRCRTESPKAAKRHVIEHDGRLITLRDAQDIIQLQLFAPAEKETA